MQLEISYLETKKYILMYGIILFSLCKNRLSEREKIMKKSFALPNLGMKTTERQK
jgi:hypothetical protein